MRRRGGWVARFGSALAFACFLFLQGPHFFPVENASAQTVFQAYSKPQAAPSFSLENLQGRTVDIGDHKGQVILVNFWSTW